MDRDIFVQNVKSLCKQKGVPPTIACRDSGVGVSFINNIISRGQTPSVEKVQLLAAYLGVTTSELLGEPWPPAAPSPVLQTAEQAATPSGNCLLEEFALLFNTLTPDAKTEVIAEMLRRQREK